MSADIDLAPETGKHAMTHIKQTLVWDHLLDGQSAVAARSTFLREVNAAQIVGITRDEMCWAANPVKTA